MEPRARASEGCSGWGWGARETRPVRGGPLSLISCVTQGTLSQSWNNPPSPLFAEGPLGGMSMGLRPLGRGHRAWAGLETQPAWQDQENRLGQLSQTLLILVCPLPLPPRHSLLLTWRKEGSSSNNHRRIATISECLLSARHWDSQALGEVPSWLL